MTDEFSSWLQRALKLRRMTQRQLAALSGVDHSTISRLVRGERRPTLTTATALRRALAAAQPAGAALADPTVSVLKALQSDKSLAATDVGEVMKHYLALREQRERLDDDLPAATKTG